METQDVVETQDEIKDEIELRRMESSAGFVTVILKCHFGVKIFFTFTHFPTNIHSIH